MQLLKDYILQQAIVPKEGILKVDSFLNHIIDPTLMIEIGKELAQRFQGHRIDKILTLEASGIAPALGTALALDVPLLFAKKTLPSTLSDGYHCKVHSFTKQKDFDIFVSKEYIKKDENILIVDDFLAMGNAILGLRDIIHMGQAHCVGAGIVIEKSFQKGRDILTNKGILVESLVQIKSLQPNNICFL